MMLCGVKLFIGCMFVVIELFCLFIKIVFLLWMVLVISGC